MSELRDRIENALNETRMLMLGAQVLVGFGYVSTFYRRFEELPEPARYAKLVSLALLLVALALIVAPVPFHNIVERGRDSMRLQRFITGVATPALLPFALALSIDL